jgi:hypothetical protein
MNGNFDLTFTFHDGSDVGDTPVVVDLVHSTLEPALSAGPVRIGRGWQAELQPGTYLVRVRFPSGLVAHRTFAIEDGKATRVTIDIRRIVWAGPS